MYWEDYQAFLEMSYKIEKEKTYSRLKSYLEELELSDAQMAKESVLGKKCRHMKTLDLNLEWKVLTHWVEELIHVDSRQPEMEVSIHQFKESTHEDSVQRMDYGVESVDTWL